MSLPRKGAAMWMCRRALAQPAITMLLAAVGCAGLLQPPQGQEFEALSEWGRREPSERPRRGNLTSRRAVPELDTDVENWSRWSDDADSESEPIWDRAICDVVLEEDGNGRRVCGPQVIVGGAMKCGTNTLGSLLQLHPRVKFNYCLDQECAQCHDSAADCLERFQGSSNMGTEVLWESHYFTHLTSQHDPPRDYESDEGRHLLARQLPRVDGVHNLTVDKSPSYLDAHIFPDVVTHARRLLPHAKVIFSLCDPATRLYAEYHHSLKWDEKTLYGSFDEAEVKRPADFAEWVAALQEDSEFCRLHTEKCADARRNFLSKGIYADNVRRWFDTFGEHAVLVVNLVDGMDLKQQAAQVLAHVGLPFEEYPWERLNEMGHGFVNHDYNGRWYAWTEAPEAMATLKGFYSSHNARLADLLHQYWPRDW